MLWCVSLLAYMLVMLSAHSGHCGCLNGTSYLSLIRINVLLEIFSINVILYWLHQANNFIIIIILIQSSEKQSHHWNLCPLSLVKFLPFYKPLTISSSGPHVLSFVPILAPSWLIRALMPRSALLVAPRGRTGHQGKPVQPTPMGKTARLGPALTQAASPYPTTLSLSIRLRRKESRKRLI